MTDWRTDGSRWLGEVGSANLVSTDLVRGILRRAKRGSSKSNVAAASQTWQWQAECGNDEPKQCELRCNDVGEPTVANDGERRCHLGPSKLMHNGGRRNVEAMSYEDHGKVFFPRKAQRGIFAEEHSAEGAFCRRGVLPNRRSADEAFYQGGVLPKRHSADKVFSREGSLLTKYSSGEAFCRGDILQRRHSVEKALCRRSVLPRKYFADEAFCQRGVLPTRGISDLFCR